MPRDTWKGNRHEDRRRILEALNARRESTLTDDQWVAHLRSNARQALKDLFEQYFVRADEFDFGRGPEPCFVFTENKENPKPYTSLRSTVSDAGMTPPPPRARPGKLSMRAGKPNNVQPGKEMIAQEQVDVMYIRAENLLAQCQRFGYDMAGIAGDFDITLPPPGKAGPEKQ